MPIYYIIVAECVGRHVPLFFFYVFITSTSKKQMHYLFSTCKGSPAPRRIVQGRAPLGFAEKIILAVPAPVFFRKALHYPGTGRSGR